MQGLLALYYVKGASAPDCIYLYNNMCAKDHLQSA